MKNLLLTIVALFAFSALSFGQTISGTPHDMSAEAWNPATTNKLCGTCHTPHNALAIVETPLWSHTVSVAAYTMYTSAQSSTFDATPAAAPDGNSKLCLSCHDNTVAMDDFVGVTSASGTMSVEYAASTAIVGTDLSNDHPISFTYDAALATTDGGLYDPTTTNSGLGGTIDADMLFSGKMQCASCHNPHDNQYTSFQRMSNTNSELCLTCHNK